jgi:hypothetical protein
MWNATQYDENASEKTKKQMGGCGPQRCNTTTRDKRKKEKS